VTKKTNSYGRQPCSECGSIGARHFKTCSKATSVKGWKQGREDARPSGKKGRTILDTAVRLTESEFGDVVEALNDGLTLEQVGFNYPDVDLSEIRKAKFAEGYKDYLAGK
jgi:hypothetical protein